MKVLILNGSPRKQGTVATLLRAVAEGAAQKHEVEWVDVYDLKMRPCLGCMKCRPEGECVQPEDDAHRVGRQIKEAGALVVGTPTYFSNMSAMLKMLFERNETVFVNEKPKWFPIQNLKGRPAVIVTACTTPWPLNWLLPVSRGAVRAVNRVLKDSGCKVLGKVVKTNTRYNHEISDKLLQKARGLGKKL
ncbi:MAG: flavodoxin family protein [Deltaproteobacteria bacterium]|nr:flavodoxin family protein [Deltaproteobacteria bacterium]